MGGNLFAQIAEKSSRVWLQAQLDLGVCLFFKSQELGFTVHISSATTVGQLTFLQHQLTSGSRPSPLLVPGPGMPWPRLFSLPLKMQSSPLGSPPVPLLWGPPSSSGGGVAAHPVLPHTCAPFCSKHCSLLPCPSLCVTVLMDTEPDMEKESLSLAHRTISPSQKGCVYEPEV